MNDAVSAIWPMAASRGPRIRFLCGSAALAGFLCVVLIVWLRVGTHSVIDGAPNVSRWAMQDFRDAIYYPVVALLHGVNPYDPVVYPSRYPVGQRFPLYLPSTLLIHAPFAALRFETALRCYYALSVILTVVLAWYAWRLCDETPNIARTFAVATLIALARPGEHNLLAGQCTLQIVLATYAAMAYAERRPLVSAAALAVAMAKPTFGIPVACLLWAQRQSKPVVVGGLLAALLSLPVLAMLSLSAGGWAALVESFSASHSFMLADPMVDAVTTWSRVDAAPLFVRALGQTLSGYSEYGITLVIVGVTALALRRVTRCGAASVVRQIVPGLVCLTILTCVYHQGYDLLLLVYPALLLSRSGRLDPWRQQPLLRVLLLTIGVVLAVNYLSSWSALTYFGIRQLWRQIITSVNGAAVLVAWLVYVGLAFRAARTAAITATEANIGRAPLANV